MRNWVVTAAFAATMAGSAGAATLNISFSSGPLERTSLCASQVDDRCAREMEPVDADGNPFAVADPAPDTTPRLAFWTAEMTVDTDEMTFVDGFATVGYDAITVTGFRPHMIVAGAPVVPPLDPMGDSFVHDLWLTFDAAYRITDRLIMLSYSGADALWFLDAADGRPASITSWTYGSGVLDPEGYPYAARSEYAGGMGTFSVAGAPDAPVPVPLPLPAGLLLAGLGGLGLLRRPRR